MSQTTTPSGADVPLSVLLVPVGDMIAKLHDDAAWETYMRAYRAITALIARNAELEAERDELERLCDATYVQHGADAYQHACEVLEAWQEARFVADKDRGCEGSLCDGLSWLQSQVTKLEADRDALAAENKALKADAERWQEVSRRFDGSKTSAACLTLEGLGLEPTPYRSFAENVDAALARTPAKESGPCDSSPTS